MTGFRLSWRIEKVVPKDNSSGEELENEAEDVLPKYSDVFFSQLVQVAGQMRMKKMTRQEILKETIQQKVRNTTFLQQYWCEFDGAIHSLADLQMLNNLNYQKSEPPSTTSPLPFPPLV